MFEKVEEQAAACNDGAPKAPLVDVDVLPNAKQAFVLGMVQGNVFPKGVVRKSHPWFSKTRKGFDCLSGSGYRRMQELERGGFAVEVAQGKEVADHHWSGWAKGVVQQLMNGEQMEPADWVVEQARKSADEFCMPQTVFWTNDGAGWRNTNPYASVLVGARTHVTILPQRYFN